MKHFFFVLLLVTFFAFFPTTVIEAAPNSDLPWASGVHTANELQPHLDFGTWRGNPTDVIVASFNVRDAGWGSLTKPTNIFDGLNYKSYDGILVLSVAMYPQGQGNNAACASGAYDNYWKEAGSYLDSIGRNSPSTIIRIGWEFNGDFMYWHSDADPTNFKTCWNNVAKAIRSTAPNVLLDWTFNAHGSPFPASGNPFDAYPGDEYVDIIGIDSYDHYPPSHDQAAWDNQCNTNNGLCYVINFAREHGKLFSVAEWGVAVGSADGGGDNPFYIEKMFETFMENRDILAYEAYYNAPISIEPGNVGSGIYPAAGSVDAPQSSAKYLELFGNNSPANGLGGGVDYSTWGAGTGGGGGTVRPSPTPTSIPLPYYPEISPWVFIIPGIIIFLAVMFQ
ncbi:MAG: glycosyl hydrolase [Patescibacteria group bacterium]